MKKIISSIYKKGFFHLLSVNFLSQFLAFGSILLVAKFLSPVELGEVKILQSYTNIFVVLAGFGINSVVLKTCSENREEQEKERILHTAFSRAVIFIGISLAILAILTFSGIITSSRRLALWLLIYSAVIPFAVGTDILSVYLQALKRIQDMARAQILIKGQLFIIVVISSWLWGFEGFIFATIVSYIVGLIPVLRKVGLGFLSAGPELVPKGMYHLAIFSFLANVVAVLSQYTDIIILDHFGSVRSEIGNYSLATVFVLGATQVTATIQSISTPYFSERASEEQWFRRKLVHLQTQTMILSLGVALGVYLVAKILLPLAYGPAYQSAINYLAVLLLKYVIFSSYAIIGIALFALGFVKYNFVSAAVSMVVGVPFSYFMLKHYGIMGISWAQVLIAAVAFIIQFWLMRVALLKKFKSQC